MIRVERGEAPAFVREPDFVAARERFEAYRFGGGSRATQTFLDAASALGPLLPRVTEYVVGLFHGKCAYTEVPVPSPTLHLHRPETDAVDERQASSPNHYWWTALWYRNWYLASPEVASLKRNLFPVLGEVRAPEPGPEQVRDGEVPPEFLDLGQLLDPCEDHPQLHLEFADDGTVTPWATRPAPWLPPGHRERGETTVSLLDLNQRRLVDSRYGAVSAALRAMTDLWLPPPELIDAGHPHLGAVRQAIARQVLAQGGEAMTDSHRAVLPELVPYLLAEPGRYAAALVAQVAAALRESTPDLATFLEAPIEVSEPQSAEAPPSEPELPPPDPAAPSPPPAPATRLIPLTAAVSRVLIHDFQAIEDFELEVPVAVETTAPPPVTKTAPLPAVGTSPQTPDLPRLNPTGRPWRVFLGENGSGKSSALRAIALALAGDQVDALVAECGLAWSDLLRRGSEEGRVLVEFTGGHSIDLRFTADGPTPKSRSLLPRMGGFARGFGATRLKSDAGVAAAGNVRLGNLFDPLQPVADAQRWLVELAARDDTGDFNVAAVTIARLLGREDQVLETGDPVGPRFIQVVDDEVFVRGEPMRTLSDGYQAIITLACDLMAGAGSGLSDMRNATGLVLIDELGCYLHPRWKMQITRTLRDVFPSMQFFVTTHEPLCLRGLVEWEVVRVTPSSTTLGEAWHAVFEPVEESPSKYRVDRLLTSAFFGLDTTIDPDVEQQFLQYYKLIRDPAPADPAAEERRKSLRASLSQHGILGYTARDQLIYDAIDQFLAKSPQLEPESRRLQRQQTLDAVVDIWRNVAARRGGGVR